MNALRTSSSCCDTTPLKRLESQSSNSEPSSPTSFSSKGVRSSAGAAGGGGVEGGGGGCGDNLTKTSTTKRFSLPNCNHCNYKNNNDIEIHLSGFAGQLKPEKMHRHETRRVCYRILVDILMLSCVVLPIIFFRVWGQPHKRGFFCDDASLKHPYYDSTVQAWMLYMMGFVLPVSVIVSVEFFKSNENKMRGLGSYSEGRYYFLYLEIADWIVESYKKAGLLIFGIGVGQLTSDIAKYSVGRLRPHFFAVCQPLMYDGTTCDDPRNADRYIEDFECMGIDVNPKLLKQVHLSFPSGHSVFAFFTMVYLSIYLQKHMKWQRSKMLKHLLQFFCLMLAWYTALTRVSDYKHHWTDVFAGSAIGTFSAFLISCIW